jgi:hypothetical protein
LGFDPNSRAEEITNLKRWLISEHKTNIFDISSWNEDGSWKDWRLGETPIHLKNQVQLLLSLLKGASPLHRNLQDN